LLKEEEERREEERIKKEAARERRRREKQRREEEEEKQIGLGTRFIGPESEQDRSQVPESESLVSKLNQEIESETDGMTSSLPEGSSSVALRDGRLHHDASRLQRLSQTSTLGDTMHEVAPNSSPKRPSAEEYKIKLAALRSVPLEREEDGSSDFKENLTPLLRVVDVMQNESPASDSVTRFSFPNKPSTPTGHQYSRQYLSPDPNHSSPQSSPSQGPSSSPTSPRKNGHRRNGNREGGGVDVISLSANSPSLQQSRMASRLQSLLGSSMLEEEEDSLGIDAEKVETSHQERGTPTRSMRRVTFSPQPQVIENIVEENSEWDGDSDEVVRGEEHRKMDDQMEAVAEELKIDLNTIEEAIGESSPQADPEQSSHRLSGTPLRRTFASPMFPGTYFSPSMAAQPSSSFSYSRHVLRPRQQGGQDEEASKGTRETTLRSSSPPLRAWSSSPLQHAFGPPRSRSSSSIISTSDFSISGELGAVKEDEGWEEDQVTMGSGFQGQAPIQSTPPRVSPLMKTRSLSSMDVDEGQADVANDSLQRTLQQLKNVLHKVKEIKSEDIQRDGPALPLESSDGKEEGEIVQSVVTSLIEETSQKADELDEAYLEKLGTIRERLRRFNPLQSIGMKESHTSSTSHLKGWLITLLLQLALALLMIMAAELRAKQLFLTIYYDPFQPHDFLDIPPTSAGGLLAPFFQKWKSMAPIGEYFLKEDSSTQFNRHWTQTVTWAMRDTVYGPDRMKTCKHFIVKFATLLGFDGTDDFQMRGFVPT